MGIGKINLTKQTAYSIGLITVIFLTIFNQILIQKILSEQKFDATVINLAGRQRMLSQKIVKEAYQVIRENFAIEELKKEVIRWDSIHISLQAGSETLKIPQLDSEYIQSLFDELNPYQQALSSSILGIENKDQLAEVLSDISKNERAFLPRMDRIVYAIEQESGIGIRNLILLEIALAIFSLFVLLIEFRYIFKPLFENLDTKNQKLEATIRELSESKGDLFKSTQRFDLSIEAINAGIWDWYIPDGTEWWSDKFYNLLGYKPGEIPATYTTFLYELVHIDDKEKVEKAVKAHLEKKKKYKLEIRMKMKNGHYRWFESVGQASWDFEGNPIRMVGSIIDIEEKKQFEFQIQNDGQALRVQKAELEKALKDLSEIQAVAKIGTWEVDLKTMTAYWSDEVYRIHQIENGTPIKVEEGINFYREDFRPIIQNAIDTAIAEKKSWDEMCVLVTKTGREIWVRAIGFPVFEKEKLVALRGLFMDMDRERRAIEKKQETELIFSSIFNNTFNFTGLLEPDGTLIQANKSALEFGGFKLEDAKGLNFADAPWWSLSEKINWELRESIEKAAKGEFIRYDVDVVGKGGKVITIDFSIAPIFNNENEILYLVVEGRDISERKELEEEVADKALRLVEAQEIGKIGNWNWDMEEDVITWSDQNYKVFGQKKNFKPDFEALNQLTHPDDREPFRKDVERAIKENRAHDFIHRIVLKGGKEIKYIHERGKVYYHPNGKPYRMAGTSQDVTEQLLKELELNKKTELLELNKKQLQTFISHAPVAVAMLDNEMHYITASNKWYKDYNIEGREIIGESHYDIFPEIRENKAWLEDHKRVLAGEELENERDRFVRKDGSIQWISWKLLPWYDEPGEVGGIIMYTADVTNEMKYQETLENLNEVLEHQVLKRTEELNIVNKELEAFSYSISHDLRAPLRSINGFADILEEDYKEALDEEGKRLLGIIKSSGIKMGQLIDDILSFSRLGRKELKKTDVLMNELLSDVIAEQTILYPDLNIKFGTENLLNVKGDIALLKQVMINLISNAIKYSAKEKEIKIHVKSVEKEKTIVYSVSDNGTGFNMKYHDKLFGVFQRLHSPNDYEGTGVGLAIVKRIIRKHGGEIWAESELGSGSTFYFSLPVK